MPLSDWVFFAHLLHQRTDPILRPTCSGLQLACWFCPGELSSTSGCAVSTGGSLIFGSNPICRYFFYKGVPFPKGSTAELDGAVEEWLDWEAMTLAPAESLLAASLQAGGPVPAETLAALEHLEKKLTGKWLLRSVSGWWR